MSDISEDDEEFRLLINGIDLVEEEKLGEIELLAEDDPDYLTLETETILLKQSCKRFLALSRRGSNESRIEKVWLTLIEFRKRIRLRKEWIARNEGMEERTSEMEKEKERVGEGSSSEEEEVLEGFNLETRRKGSLYKDGKERGRKGRNLTEKTVEMEGGGKVKVEESRKEDEVGEMESEELGEMEERTKEDSNSEPMEVDSDLDKSSPTHSMERGSFESISDGFLGLSKEEEKNLSEDSQEPAVKAYKDDLAWARAPSLEMLTMPEANRMGSTEKKERNPKIKVEEEEERKRKRIMMEGTLEEDEEIMSRRNQERRVYLSVKRRDQRRISKDGTRDKERDKDKDKRMDQDKDKDRMEDLDRIEVYKEKSEKIGKGRIEKDESWVPHPTERWGESMATIWGEVQDEDTPLALRRSRRGVVSKEYPDVKVQDPCLGQTTPVRDTTPVGNRFLVKSADKPPTGQAQSTQMSRRLDKMSSKLEKVLVRVNDIMDYAYVNKNVKKEWREACRWVPEQIRDIIKMKDSLVTVSGKIEEEIRTQSERKDVSVMTSPPWEFPPVGSPLREETLIRESLRIKDLGNGSRKMGIKVGKRKIGAETGKKKAPRKMRKVMKDTTGEDIDRMDVEVEGVRQKVKERTRLDSRIEDVRYKVKERIRTESRIEDVVGKPSPVRDMILELLAEWDEATLYRNRLREIEASVEEKESYILERKRRGSHPLLDKALRITKDMKTELRSGGGKEMYRRETEAGQEMVKGTGKKDLDEEKWKKVGKRGKGIQTLDGKGVSVQKVQDKGVGTRPPGRVNCPRWATARPEAIIIPIKDKEQERETYERIYNKFKDEDVVRKMRTSRKGDMIMEVNVGHEVGMVKRQVYDILKDTDGIRTLNKVFELEVKDVDPYMDPKVVMEAIAAHLKVDIEELTVKTDRRTGIGSKVVVVNTPTRLIGRVLESPRMKIGFVMVHLHACPKVMRCFRCQGFGHFASNCLEKLSSGNIRCRNCGTDGHDQNDCKRMMKCWMCASKEMRDNHKLGTMACPQFRELLRYKKDQLYRYQQYEEKKKIELKKKSMRMIEERKEKEKIEKEKKKVKEKELGTYKKDEDETMKSKGTELWSEIVARTNSKKDNRDMYDYRMDENLDTYSTGDESLNYMDLLEDEDSFDDEEM